MSEAHDTLWKLSAVELMHGYAARDFSPVEVTQCLLDRIDRLDPVLHAFVAVNADGAMRAARAAEALWMSPGDKPALCGVPVSVKDTIEMEGMPTTYGSLAFKDNQRPDAELVRRLKTAGAVILGKTNTPEFALAPRTENRLSAPTVNPWNVDRTAGGSSGGAGAAVAAGLGPIAIGTDSAGSIRLPSAYQGIYGLKPSFQRIPSVQDWRASPARSHNGPMTRTVRDAALLMQAIAGPDARDAGSALYPPVDYLSYPARGIRNVRGLRVAISRDFGRGLELGAEQESMLEEAAQHLRSLGCTIVPADPPILSGGDELEPGVWAYSGDHYAAIEKLVPDFWDQHNASLTDYARPIYDAGRRALAWHYRRILQRDAAYSQQMRVWFRDYDFLLSPCCGAAPPATLSEVRDDRKGQFGLLAPFNLSHNPAAAIPFGFSSEGLPLAVQLVGRVGDDIGVLRLSGLLEALRPWGQNWPSFDFARQAT